MNKIIVVCLVAMLAAPLGANASPPDGASVGTTDLADVKLRIGRLRTKVAQAFAAFFAVTDKKGMYNVIDPSSDRPQTEVLVVYRELYFAASFTKGVSEVVCSDQATKPLCGPTFNPAWLVYPKDANPSNESLVQWTNETELAIEPLWQGLCKLAVEKTGNRASCGAV
jgi:hypothetical protein